jgi:hypothetical protein
MTPGQRLPQAGAIVSAAAPGSSSRCRSSPPAASQQSVPLKVQHRCAIAATPVISAQVWKATARSRTANLTVPAEDVAQPHGVAMVSRKAMAAERTGLGWVLSR